MKRSLALAVTAVLALSVTGFAVAKSLDGNNKAVRAVAGAFTATTASRVETRTCTTADGKTLVSTNGMYTGTATGDADLTGNATIQARSLINTTDAIGIVTGSLRIDVPGRNTSAHFDTVYSAGQIAGFATGRAHDPAAALLANLSATFSPTAGFTNGKLGGGTAGGAAAEVGLGKCEPTRTIRQTSEAHGTVSAVSSSSITVAGLTCAVTSADLQTKVAKLKVGDRAQIKCHLVDTTNTLVRVDGRR